MDLSRLPAWLRQPPRGLLLAARAAAVLVVVGVVVKVGADNASSVRHVHFRVSPGWFVPTAGASLTAGLLMPLGWRLLVRAYGAHVGIRATLRLWWTAQITRYVPTGAAALATRVVLAGREGVPRWLAGASLPIEVSVVVAWGTALTGVLLPSSVIPTWARAVLVLSALAGLAGLPLLLRLAGRYVPKMPGPVEGSSAWGWIYGSEGFYGVNSWVRTAAFVLLARALVPVSAGEIALLAGAFNAGAVGGLVSIAPGGLGVREGIMTLILRQRFGFGDAAALAVALRAWDVGIDIIWVITARVAGMSRWRSDPINTRAILERQ